MAAHGLLTDGQLHRFIALSEQDALHARFRAFVRRGAPDPRWQEQQREAEARALGLRALLAAQGDDVPS